MLIAIRLIAIILIASVLRLLESPVHGGARRVRRLRHWRIYVCIHTCVCNITCVYIYIYIYIFIYRERDIDTVSFQKIMLVFAA